LRDNESQDFQKRIKLLDAYERMERFFDWYLLISSTLKEIVQSVG